MPISTYAGFITKLKSPSQIIPVIKQGSTAPITGLHASLWRSGMNLRTADNTNPTTAVALDNTSLGALGQKNSTAVQRIASIKCASSFRQIVIIADRLSHQGSLVGNVNTTQTTNLPTAAITRYTSGVGVWAGIEIYSQIGVSATTFVMSYTNQNGDPGRTTKLCWIGGSSYRNAGRLLIPGLQTGDTGVRSVESVTLTASTGTAGAMGVVLFKPLLMLPIDGVSPVQNWNALIGLNQFVEVLPNACLFLIQIPFTNSAFIDPLIQADIALVEE